MRQVTVGSRVGYSSYGEIRTGTVVTVGARGGILFVADDASGLVSFRHPASVTLLPAPLATMEG